MRATRCVINGDPLEGLLASSIKHTDQSTESMVSILVDSLRKQRGPTREVDNTTLDTNEEWQEMLQMELQAVHKARSKVSHREDFLNQRNPPTPSDTAVTAWDELESCERNLCQRVKERITAKKRRARARPAKLPTTTIASISWGQLQELDQHAKSKFEMKQRHTSTQCGSLSLARGHLPS